MKKLLAVSILAAAITLPLIGGRVGAKQTTTPPKVQATLISTMDAKKMIGEKKVFLLDVHTPEQTHIPGTDAFVPYDQIEANLNRLPSDKNTPILVYCRSGSMSQIAGEKLKQLGYATVYDLEGGVNAYREINAEVTILPSSQNLGQVIYGDVAETEFILTNFTPAPLKITRVSTSCGCTKANADQKELKPYESTVIKVAFDPAVHKDDTDLGELTRTVYIETDNPNFPKLTAEIQAVVTKKE